MEDTTAMMVNGDSPPPASGSTSGGQGSLESISVIVLKVKENQFPNCSKDSCNCDQKECSENLMKFTELLTQIIDCRSHLCPAMVDNIVSLISDFSFPSGVGCDWIEISDQGVIENADSHLVGNNGSLASSRRNSRVSSELSQISSPSMSSQIPERVGVVSSSTSVYMASSSSGSPPDGRQQEAPLGSGMDEISSSPNIQKPCSSKKVSEIPSDQLAGTNSQTEEDGTPMDHSTAIVSQVGSQESHDRNADTIEGVNAASTENMETEEIGSARSEAPPRVVPGDLSPPILTITTKWINMNHSQEESTIPGPTGSEASSQSVGSMSTLTCGSSFSEKDDNTLTEETDPNLADSKSSLETSDSTSPVSTEEMGSEEVEEHEGKKHILTFSSGGAARTKALLGMRLAPLCSETKQPKTDSRPSEDSEEEEASSTEQNQPEASGNERQHNTRLQARKNVAETEDKAEASSIKQGGVPSSSGMTATKQTDKKDLRSNTVKVSEPNTAKVPETVSPQENAVDNMEDNGKQNTPDSRQDLLQEQEKITTRARAPLNRPAPLSVKRRRVAERTAKKAANDKISSYSSSTSSTSSEPASAVPGTEAGSRTGGKRLRSSDVDSDGGTGNKPKKRRVDNLKEVTNGCNNPSRSSTPTQDELWQQDTERPGNTRSTRTSKKDTEKENNSHSSADEANQTRESSTGAKNMEAESESSDSDSDSSTASNETQASNVPLMERLERRKQKRAKDQNMKENQTKQVKKKKHHRPAVVGGVPTIKPGGLSLSSVAKEFLKQHKPDKEKGKNPQQPMQPPQPPNKKTREESIATEDDDEIEMLEERNTSTSKDRGPTSSKSKETGNADPIQIRLPRRTSASGDSSKDDTEKSTEASSRKATLTKSTSLPTTTTPPSSSPLPVQELELEDNRWEGGRPPSPRKSSGPSSWPLTVSSSNANNESTPDKPKRFPISIRPQSLDASGSKDSLSAENDKRPSTGKEAGSSETSLRSSLGRSYDPRQEAQKIGAKAVPKVTKDILQTLSPQNSAENATSSSSKGKAQSNQSVPSQSAATKRTALDDDVVVISSENRNKESSAPSNIQVTQQAHVQKDNDIEIIATPEKSKNSTTASQQSSQSSQSDPTRSKESTATPKPQSSETSEKASNSKSNEQPTSSTKTNLVFVDGQIRKVPNTNSVSPSNTIGGTWIRGSSNTRAQDVNIDFESDPDQSNNQTETNRNSGGGQRGRGRGSPQQNRRGGQHYGYNPRYPGSNHYGPRGQGPRAQWEQGSRANQINTFMSHGRYQQQDFTSDEGMMARPFIFQPMGPPFIPQPPPLPPIPPPFMMPRGYFPPGNHSHPPRFPRFNM